MQHTTFFALYIGTLIVVFPHRSKVLSGLGSAVVAGILLLKTTSNQDTLQALNNEISLSFALSKKKKSTWKICLLLSYVFLDRFVWLPAPGNRQLLTNKLTVSS